MCERSLGRVLGGVLAVSLALGACAPARPDAPDNLGAPRSAPARLADVAPGQTPSRLALPVAASAEESARLLTERPDLARWLADEGRGWRVFFDRRSGEPMLLEGPGLPWATTSQWRLATTSNRGALLARTAAERALAFASSRAALFGRGAAGLTIDARATGSADRDGTLVVATLAAARGGLVRFVVSHGRLVQIHVDGLVGGPAPDARPPLSRQDALAHLVRDLGLAAAPTVLASDLETVRLSTTAEAPGVYAGRVGDGYDTRLVRSFRFTVPGSVLTYVAIVDARTGETLDAWDDNRYGAVTGGVYPHGPEAAETVVPFANVRVANGSTNVTDLGGNYDYVGGAATTTLNGPSLNLNDNCGAPTAQATAAPGDLSLGTSTSTNCAFSVDGHTTRAGRNAIYHLNNARSTGIKWLDGVNFDGTEWFASNVGVNVNISQTCNAYWDGSTLNFFREGGGCANTAEIADVVHHEWLHGLDQNTKSGSVGDAAKGEAVGDTMAMLMSHDSCIGAGFFLAEGSGETTSCSTGVRDLAFNVTKANISSVCARTVSCAGALGYECHCESHLLSGAHWQLAQLYVARYGADEGWNRFERGFLRALPFLTSYADGNGPGSAYTAWLVGDDDDGDITDGTPNADLIFQAFNGHGIAGTQRPAFAAACGAPLSPVAVAATPGPTGVALSWPVVAGAASYSIFRSQGHNDTRGFLPLATDLTATSFSDTQVHLGLPYAYQVVANVAVDGALCPTPYGTAPVATPGAAPPSDDFSISVSPTSATVQAGASTTVTVTTAVVSGAAASVSLSVSGLPAGVAGSFSPATVTAGGTSTLTLTAASAATLGAATFTVTGAMGATSHSASASLTVEAAPPPPAPDFSLALAPPSVALAAGGSTTVTVSTALTSGAAQTISLSVSGLPAGVTGSFSPASVVAGGSATLTLVAASSAASSAATFTVTGTGGATTHAASGSLTVTALPPPAPDFSIALSPSSLGVTAGASVTATVTTAVTSGAASSIALSISGLPAGVAASFSPATVTAGGSSTLTLTASASAAAATASFTVTGTGGGASHATGGTLTVKASPVVVALRNGVPVVKLSGDAGSSKLFSFEVPVGTAVVGFTTVGGRGDVDLYVKRGEPPTTASFDCKASHPGNVEACVVPRPAAGTWYVRVEGVRAYDGVAVVAVGVPVLRRP
jgi:hypothetical protein